jgi:tetratricopeptide (TPR) repeat protein
MDNRTLPVPAPEITRSVADPNATTGSDVLSVAGEPLVTAARYTLGEEIARGGMGEVYRATDEVLNREVAVKVLQAKFGPGSGNARRFHDEARITAQLQHPGVPPVHDLGTLPDGRPFLAMKLIRGETLDELLKRRADPADDRGRFVAAFEGVCQAVAYAHAHGVIHRDLKPLNVMVGAFGEVQVMDWGLAKVLADPGPTPAADPDSTAASTRVQTGRSGDGPDTQAGSVLGTPAYMAPEQAAGAVGKVDARSDVFGLGGVLAAILTGRPPFVADTAETTRVKAAQGDVADCFARLDGCGADPGLIALCKQCLQARPADRPADAGAVARAVAELRQAADERARQAELDKVRVEGEVAAAAVARAERRKRRRVWQAAGGVLLAVLALGVVGTTWGLFAARRERDEAEAARREADANAEKARAAEAAAGKQALLALSTIQLVITEVDDRLAREPKTADLRIALLKLVEKKWDELDVALAGGLQGQAVPTLMAVRGKLADAWVSLDQLAEADAQYRKLYDQAEERVALKNRNDASRTNLAVLCNAWAPVKSRLTGDPGEAVRLYGRAVELAREIRRDPRPEPGSPAGYQVADVLLRALLQLASAAVKAGDRAKAGELYAEVGEVTEDLLRDIAAKADWFTQLEPDRQQKVQSYFTQNLELSRTGRANNLCALGKVDEAVVIYRGVIGRSRAAAAKASTDPNARDQLALQLRNFGQYMLRSGRAEEAAALLTEAVELTEQNFDQDPTRASFKHSLHYSLYYAGVARDARGQTAEAQGLFERSRTLRAELAAVSPDKSNKVNLMLAEARLGNAKPAKTLADELSASAKKDPDLRLDVARAMAQLARRAEGAERDGFRKAALDALERCLADGQTDLFMIAGEQDLTPVREDPRYREIVARLRPAGGPKPGR